MRVIAFSAMVCFGLVLGFDRPVPAAEDVEPATQTAPAESQPAGPSPVYRCDKPVHELSHAWAGDQIEHVFTIHNDGEGTLEILNIDSACGCFVASDYTKTIPPGESGRIPVSLATAPQAEAVEKHMVVYTNEPASPEHPLTVKAKLVPRIRMLPTHGASWGRLLPGTSNIRVIKLINNMKEPMELELGPGEQGPFTATLNEIEPGRVAELTVKFERPLSEGHHQGQIHLKTGFKDEPKLVVPCTLLVPPPLETVPIAFSPMKTRQEVDRQTILIRYNGENPMRILSIVPSDPKVGAALTTKEAGRVYHLVVTIPANYKPANDEPLEVKVATDVENKKELFIPIYARALTSQPAQIILAE